LNPLLLDESDPDDTNMMNHKTTETIIGPKKDNLECGTKKYLGIIDPKYAPKIIPGIVCKTVAVKLIVYNFRFLIPKFANNL
jgi:hypothetical protein